MDRVSAVCARGKESGDRCQCNPGTRCSSAAPTPSSERRCIERPAPPWALSRSKAGWYFRPHHAIDEVRALSLVRPAKNLPASLNGATVVAVEEHSIGKRELPPF